MPLKPYLRPELTEVDQAEAKALANKLSATPPFKMRAALWALLLENIRLAHECNEHRRARGFEPLPVTQV